MRKLSPFLGAKCRSLLTLETRGPCALPQQSLVPGMQARSHQERSDGWSVGPGRAQSSSEVGGMCTHCILLSSGLLTSFRSAVANRSSVRSERLPTAALDHHTQTFHLLHYFHSGPSELAVVSVLKGPVTFLDLWGEVSLLLLFSALSVLPAVAQAMSEICVGMSLLGLPTVCRTHCTTQA